MGATTRALQVAALVLLAGVAAVAAGAVAGGEADRALLPDLRPAEPGAFGILTVEDPERGRRFLLGFRAAIENVGSGPLVIDGHRADPDRPEMAITQVITHTRGPSRRRPVADTTIDFQPSPDHRHWHYQQIIAYRLRHAATGALAADGRKTGFCLGDRYRLRPAVPAWPDLPAFTGDCGRDKPERTHLRQGLSVGYGDPYPAFLEGQAIDVTGLPAGAYLLEHEVDPDRLLAETTRANNTAAIRVQLTWPHGPDQPPEISSPGISSTGP